MKATTLVGRILYSLIFIFAAFGHFKPDTIAFAAAQGVPLAKLAVPASGILSLAGGLSIALGYRTKLGAWALVLFLVPVTLMLHNFWTVTDPMTRQMQMAMFMKNVALLGGALLLAVHGAGAYSLDALSVQQPAAADAPTAARG
jgi:putative oxidoreductase